MLGGLCHLKAVVPQLFALLDHTHAQIVQLSRFARTFLEALLNDQVPLSECLLVGGSNGGNQG